MIDKNVCSQDTSRIILKLKKILFIVYTISFIFILTFAIGLNKIRKAELAQTVLSQVKENLILRNIRPVLISLEDTTNSSFTYIKYYDYSGKIIFKIHPENDISGSDFFIQKITIPIYLEFDKNTEQGFIEFGYSISIILILALVFWLLLVFVGFMIFSRYEKQIQKEQEYLIKIKNAESINTLAKQVSHDIRSPLVALNMLLGYIQSIPEHQRLVIRNSINRISDIANTLLQNSKEQKQGTNQNQMNSRVDFQWFQLELLPAIVDTIVSEKRVKFRDKIGIEIETDYNDSYGAFAKINSTEVKRVLSNLINNAVEAFQDNKGKVIISVRKTVDSTVIIVADNGKGIPKHILEKLGEEGVSHGKEGTNSGSGLGVYHAKKTIEGFGGKLTVESQELLGTTITMTFPPTIAPNWFVDKLNLSPKMQVVSLDDDLSIHGVWHERFHSKNIESKQIEHLSFTSGSEFQNWINSQDTQEAALKSRRLYLVDFELLNQNKTGLEIIEELNLGNQTILVTSRYEETQIRAKCEKLGVKLIPKGMAPWIPIEIETEREFFDMILLDDDELPHMTWKMMALEKRKKLISFYKANDFFERANEFDLSSTLFIDSNLGNGIKGEDVSMKASEMGFKNIYLCTGYDQSEFSDMPWLKGIIGKEYPNF